MASALVGLEFPLEVGRASLLNVVPTLSQIHSNYLKGAFRRVSLEYGYRGPSPPSSCLTSHKTESRWMFMKVDLTPNIGRSTVLSEHDNMKGLFSPLHF